MRESFSCDVQRGPGTGEFCHYCNSFKNKKMHKFYKRFCEQQQHNRGWYRWTSNGARPTMSYLAKITFKAWVVSAICIWPSMDHFEFCPRRRWGSSELQNFPYFFNSYLKSFVFRHIHKNPNWSLLWWRKVNRMRMCLVKLGDLSEKKNEKMKTRIKNCSEDLIEGQKSRLEWMKNFVH